MFTCVYTCVCVYEKCLTLNPTPCSGRLQFEAVSQHVCVHCLQATSSSLQMNIREASLLEKHAKHNIHKAKQTQTLASSRITAQDLHPLPPEATHQTNLSEIRLSF